MFAQAGGVELLAVVTDRETGQSRGFGFVEMASAEEATEAVKKFNDHEVEAGRCVELATSAGAGGSRESGTRARRFRGLRRAPLSTLECEVLDRDHFRTPAEAQRKLFDCIEG